MFNQIISISNPKGRGLQATHSVTLMINLLVWIGLLAGMYLRLDSPPVQARAGERSAAHSAQEGQALEPGKPLERELSGGGSHSYRITMTSGQYLQVVVDQRGIDVLVVLSAPDGQKIIEVNSVRVNEKSEAFSIIAEVAGTYLIEVRAAEKTAKIGHYEIQVAALRAATAQDQHRVVAESLSREARQLQNGTLEAKRKSLEKYNDALDLYRRAGDRKREALALIDIGAVYYLLGETQKALEKFKEALPLSRAVGDRRMEAEMLNHIGRAYWSLGEAQKALENYNEALPISRAVGYRNGEAATLSNIGQIYRSSGDMRKALEIFNQALPIIRAVGERNGEAVTLNNIGLVYDSLGEMQKALDKYYEALPIFRGVDDRRGEAIALNNIGSVYWSSGEMQKALDKYHEALSIRRAVGDRRGEAVTLNNIGLVYLSSEEIKKALGKFNESLLLSRGAGDRGTEAITLNNIGEAYRLLGELQKAMETLNDALLISRVVGDRSIEADALQSMGGVFRSSGELQKALEKFNEALLISQAIDYSGTKASVLHNIGVTYWLLGEMQEAMEKYRQTLPIRRAVSDRHGEAATLLGMAQVEQKLGNLTQARQAVEEAISMIESLRTNIGSQELRASYFARRQDYYKSYIEVLMEQYRQNPAAAIDATAFAVSERAQARSLLELLTESRADIRQGVESSLLERERSLQQRLNARASAQVRLLSRQHTPAQAEAAAKEIASLTDEYEELRAQIRTSSPRYAALTQPQPLNLIEIQQQVLDPDTLLLEYSLGENASYLFLVGHASITSYQLPKRAEIEAATRRVRELLTAPQPQPGDTEAKRQARIKEAKTIYWPQAAALSQMLLGPVASQLGTKRLLIVADGALQYLPFAALPIPDLRISASPPVRVASTPLMVEHEIVHLPSASALAILRRELAGRQPAAKAVAVLADPVFSANDARVKPVGQNHQAQAGKEASPDLTRALNDVRGELRRLLMTRDEAEAILSVTPQNASLEALDFRASRATSISDELSRYRIVHFATHGLLNSEHPALSGLVFSLVDEQGRPQEGFLRLHDIFNLRLPAELVVLSACQTGLGKEVKGEGLVGLTRGFMYAGAARVMASLWQVNDAATAELMKRFYRRMLQDGMRPAAALRAAQIEMWEKTHWKSPFYWGAFVLQGEWK